MKDIFKQLILEFEQFKLPQGILRQFEFPILPPQVRKAITLIGMRRSGKTWILYQHIQQLLSQGIPRTSILYINFEDERLSGIQGKDLQSLLDAYFELYIEHSETELQFYFDEIQNVPGWEKFVRRLLDSRQIHLYLTGSSAKLLSKEIATELRGRSLTREVFPLNFSEYLQYFQISIDPDRITAKQRAIVLHHLKNYLRLGGFPETMGTSEWIHREILQGYVQIVLYRDIVERHEIKSITVLERWMIHCMQNIASSLSINKVYNHFKSIGLQVSKNSLYEWLDYFADAYCIFPISCFDFSERKASLKQKKIYAVDPGLVTAFALHPATTLGATLETTVFRHLRQQTDRIFYYTTRQNYEIDFLIQSAIGQISLFQVTISLRDEATKSREIRALAFAMEELQLSEGTIITLEEEEELRLPQGIIHIIPAWKFFLTSTLQLFGFCSEV